jgi:hypothetical protein
MTEKTEPTKGVIELKKGAKDRAGNTVVQVLATGNEYAIYEIDDSDINNRLRVFIDAHTDEKEQQILDRFVKVKQRYIEAKGLLYRSTNYGMMKNRVAHALASSLSSDKVDGNKEFETLINKINDENKNATSSRIYYSSPAFLGTILVAIMALYFMEWRRTDIPSWQVLCVVLGSFLGGSLSIFSGLKKYRFEDARPPYYYLILGVERLFLACVAGTVAYAAIRSGIIFHGINWANYWSWLLIVVVAGFSEAFIPGVLEKISTKNGNLVS